jgi:hypothetical protein
MTEFECALTGEVTEADSSAEIPLGWTKVTIERRIPSFRWDEIQRGKETMIQAALTQLPDEAREVMLPLIALEMDARFASLEANTEEWETITEVVYISPPERDVLVMNEYNQIREKLGLDTLELQSDEDEDDDLDEDDGE